MASVTRSRRALARLALVRGLSLAALWWIVSEGQPGALLIGVGTVALATVLSIMLVPAPLPRPRIVPLIRFLPYFFVKAFLGGIDVVRRAFLPGPPLSPAFRSVSIASMSQAERISFIIIVSLEPGTLATHLRGDTLTVHVLDATMLVMEDLEELKARLALIFGRASHGGAGCKEDGR